ncbi:fimbrillin family protein [Bacteroides fragilis]|mgnify:FL=1|uniref:fimbrillin family protein n=1 Tax=Bacteroides TaxID=816 RepID=UPI00189C43DB|nr:MULTISPECIES: fimbrillin family protein [Bacteroides]MCE8622928.1 fimbrillin family protein [Bacteroides fragilis]MCE8699514.1 fimbrillin family protein [Bacteroides fragilis]MCE8703514.1 fimbrillin family protein [Bacteroides fragilis]MCE9324759.1 fimbrillin family protein [Bacteroides fragilis]MCE9446995.1 fimbrillin family protein [Bacteroides fragilis]
MKTIIRFFLSTLAVLVTGCTPEEEYIPAQGGDSFTLSSSEEQAITRAGDVSVNHFTAGTKYRLYGLIGSSWSGRLSTMNGREGTEVVGADGTHQIEYLSTGTDEDRFEGRILDFYALTYGNTTLPVCGSEAGGIPVCNITSSAGGVLPDLRRAVLTGQSGINSGVITLPFKHTLSKLKFEVVKQKPESGSTGTDVLQDIRLQGISVSDYSEGALLLSTGEYSHAGGKSDRAVLGSGFSQAVTESVLPVTIDGQSGSAAVECLIFPTLTTATEGVKINVATTGTNSGNRTDTYEIRVPVMGDDGTVQKDESGQTVTEPFRFLPNYEYTLTITITNSDVQIITIIPRRYDWIEHDDDSQYLGQPLTFNGLMWMDRNLGATSADMTTAEGWEGARGYVYQMGRSIPYYLPKTVNYRGSDGVMRQRPKSMIDANGGASPYPQIVKHESDAPIGRPAVATLALNPGDAGKAFSYVRVSGDWDNTTATSSTYWKNTKNDPCPTGWRVPTKADFDGIMPTAERYGDLTFVNHSGTSWREVASNDPEAGARTVYVCQRASGASYGVIYAIKYQGTPQAYRLMWTLGMVGDNQSVTDNGTRYRAYVTISRFPCDKNADLNISTCNTDYDWAHPSDFINLPVSGYIYPDQAVLYNAGAEVVYATSTPTGAYMYGASFKYVGNTSHRYFALYSMNRAAGVSVRCVRDVTSQ